MSQPKFKNEVELAAAVMGYLRELRWEIYQEVSFRGGCADIVATQGRQLWVVECKMTLGLGVIGQARNWLAYAHRVSIAVPRGGRSYSHETVAKDIVRMYGMGLIEAAPDTSSYSYPVNEEIDAPLHRKVFADQLRKVLCEEHKTFAQAGSSAAARWSPYKSTCQNLRTYVVSNPGVSLKTALDNIQTHYQNRSSARSSLLPWLESGAIPGVRLERDGKQVNLFPVEVRK